MKIKEIKRITRFVDDLCVVTLEGHYRPIGVAKTERWAPVRLSDIVFSLTIEEAYALIGALQDAKDSPVK